MTARVVAALVALLMLLAGCSTVPSSGDPVDYTRVADPGNQVKETAPAEGLSPQEIVRGFITASARIDQDLKLAAARSYLTTGANSTWHTGPGPVMILSAAPRFDPVAGEPELVQLSGNSDGYLTADGAYVPTGNTEFTVTIGVVDVDGEWRISNPPEQLILSVGDFNLAFTQRQVFFINHTGTLVVPDRRWLPNSSLYAVTMADQLFNRLVQGPSAPLKGAVWNGLSAVRLRVPIAASPDGVLQVDLTGVPTLSSANRRALAAQLVYSLQSDAAKIRILLDGTPLDANQAIWTTGVLGSFDPDGVPGASATTAAGYYINADGVLVNLRGTPVWGTAGTGVLRGESAGMSAATGDLALVGTVEGGGEKLYIGAPLTQVAMEERLSAVSFTPPSFSRAGDEVWTVTNGETAPEVVRLITTGSRYPVDSANLAGIGPVTGLALSPDGARVAMVAGTKLYLSTVFYSDDPSSTTPTAEGTTGGAVATIGVPVMLRNELTVSDVIWADSLNILVSASDTTSTYRTVWRIGLDGRQRSLLTTRGIVADVDAIATTGALPTLISSGGRILQLKGDDSSGEWVSANPEGQPAVGSWPLYPS